MRNTIEEGSYVLLYLTGRKRWLVRAQAEKSVHTHVGYIQLVQLIGKEYGSPIKSSLGETLWALKPTVQDLVLKGKRKTQIVYPKDLGMIAVKAGVSPGMVVVEAGTGSGALTTFLANLVRPEGHVYSFEVRPEFLKVARENIEAAGLSSYVTLKEADARDGLGVVGADIAVIDVGDPWSLVKPMWEALKGGGVLVAICPTVNQVEKLVLEISRAGFVDIESIEVLVRNLEAREGMSRPAMRMIGHTAYLTFARKVLSSG